VTVKGVTHKAGDQLWVWPKVDATVEVVGESLRVKFLWRVQPGQAAPANVFATAVLDTGGKSIIATARVELGAAPAGEGEAVFELKEANGATAVHFFLSDGAIFGGGKG